MNLVVRIPDDFAERLAAAGGDVERRALEAIVLEEFRSGRLTKPDLRRLLGFETRSEIDGFLKDHGVFDDYDMTDLERERQTLKQLGF